MHTYIIVVVHNPHSPFYVLFYYKSIFWVFFRSHCIYPQLSPTQHKTNIATFQGERKCFRTIVYLLQTLPLYICHSVSVCLGPPFPSLKWGPIRAFVWHSTQSNYLCSGDQVHAQTFLPKVDMMSLEHHLVIY